jgi:hypothetical protein
MIEASFTCRVRYQPVVREARNGLPWTALTVAVGPPGAAELVNLAVFNTDLSNLPEGTELRVEGQLTLNHWKDQRTGDWRSRMQVVVRALERPEPTGHPNQAVGARRPRRVRRRRARDAESQEEAVANSNPLPDDPMPF